MNSRVIKLLLKKEMLDVFRDRKAVIMLVLVPLIIYPLIFFGAFAVMSVIQSRMEQADYKVIVEADDDGRLEEQIYKYNLERKREAESKKKNSTNDGTQIKIVSYNSFDVSAEKKHIDNVDDLLQNEEIDLYVSSEKDSSGKLTYSTRYVSSITNSDYAESVMKEILDELSKSIMSETIEEAGMDAEEVTHPFELKRENIASTEQSAGSILGTILPFMLVVSLLMGTMYPAIDATAGEKERGTLETLLTLPVRNHEIILAKFITVAFMGILSALLNMITMGIMLIYVVKLIQSNATTNLGLSFDDINVSSFVPALLVTILAVLAFSLFISAITMCITALAKSYKEANNYITPLTLVVMLTAYIGFIPNIELTRNVALIPVANICLLIKELLLFKAGVSSVAIVLLSNVLYAILAILILGKIYDSESVLFDEGRSGLQIFQKRSNIEKGGLPTTGDAWFIVCFVLIMYIYIGSLIQLNYGTTGVFLSQLLIAVIPIIFAIYTKRSLRDTFGLKLIPVKHILGAVCFFIGMYFAVNLITAILYWLFPKQIMELNENLVDNLTGDSIWISIIIVALTPAICEELLFRGFILAGFRSKYKITMSIILVAVIFGAYHTSLIRFIPTALLGASFAYMFIKSGSIIPGMIAHFLNNFFSVILMYYPEQAERVLPEFMTGTSVSSAVISTFLGIVFLGAGVMLFRGGSPVKRNVIE